MKIEIMEKGKSDESKIGPPADVTVALNIEPFDISKPLEWNDYVEFVELNFAANNIDTLSDAQQVVKFLATAGRGIFELVRSLVAPASFRDFSVAEIKALLAKHFLPSDSVLLSTHTFYGRKKRNDETHLEYAAALKELAAGCDFGVYEDRALRDQFICGLNNPEVRDRVLRSEKDLSFKEVLSMVASVGTDAAIEAMDHDVMQTELKNGSAAASASVDSMESEMTDAKTDMPVLAKEANTISSLCKGCSKSHERSKCPFHLSMCEFCKKNGHTVTSCFLRKKAVMLKRKNNRQDNGNGKVKVKVNTKKHPSVRRRKLSKVIASNKKIKPEALKNSQTSSNGVQSTQSCNIPFRP